MTTMDWGIVGLALAAGFVIAAIYNNYINR